MISNILYIGNDLAGKTGYFSAMEKLSTGLSSEGFNVRKASKKKNIFLRIIDMVFYTIKNKKWVDVLLIDTFSTYSFYYALVISQLCRLLKIKYIPILHGGNLPNRLTRSKRLSKLIFENSFYNISPSHYLKDKFKERGFSCLLIPNSIDLSELKYTRRKIIQPKLLYVRAFADIYNPSMAVRVLKTLKDKYPNASLCMIGPDRDGTLQDVKKLIKKLDLNDSVEITGVLNRHEWYKKSEEYDVFINTTNVDNTPVSIIEAMALGLPVISTNAGGMPYLINHNIDGVLVEKNNYREMTEAIIEMIESNNLSFSIKAREKVESYSWDIVKTKWIELLS